MKVFIVLVTRNEYLKREFNKLRNSFTTERDLLGRAISVEVGVPDIDRSATLDAYFKNKSKEKDGLLVLVDNRCVDFLNFTRTALFVRRMSIPSRIEDAKSYLRHHASEHLSRFLALCNLRSGENMTASILPERNFDAPEWRQLLEHILLSAHESSFINDVGPYFSLLKKRRKPRRKSEYAALYYIDDDDKHFEYGHEHHSLPATGHPHTVACEINAKFRFGRRVEDPHRHFNVSRGPGTRPSIKGAFEDCHGEVRRH